MISLQDISIRYGERDVIKSFSAEIGQEFVSILGSNGTGKSTLAYAMAGVVPSLIEAEVRGRISIKGSVGLVMQNPGSQFLSMSVREEAGKSDLLGDLQDRNVHELSMGEKQKVNLIANITQQRDIILLDEPLELLDPYEAARFIDVVRSIKGKTIVWFDKDARFSYLADRRIELDSPSMPRLLEKRDMMRGKTGHIDIQNDIIKAKLDLRRGEKIGIIGRNGSGKTTFLKSLMGILKYKGKAQLPDLAMAPQDPGYLIEEDVGSEVGELAWLKRMGLLGLKDHDPLRLSRGQQKLVSVARAMASKAEVLLLDEPTTWLDKHNKRMLYNLITKDPRTFIISTHDPDLIRYCDTVYILEGELRCSDTKTTRRFFTGYR